jgi:tetratricopeptide (TPR) repeat protein
VERLVPADAAKEALDALDAGEKGVAIVGPEGSGKSTAIDLLRSRLDARGTKVVHVAFPQRGDDAAMVGLASLATQVAKPGDHTLSELCDPGVPWARKLKSVVDGLSGTGATLLLEDPFTRERFNSTPSVFSLRATALSDALLALPDTKTVVAARVSSMSTQFEVQARSNPSDVLLPVKWHGQLADAARQLARQDLGALARYSPLELRLAAGAIWRGTGANELVARRWEPRELLMAVLAGDDSADLRAVVARLALCRTPFDQGLLAKMGVDQLSAGARELLEQAILISTKQGQVLHDVIGRRARQSEWLDSPQKRDAHGLLAGWHRGQFAKATAAQKVEAAVRNEMEAVHHFTEAGDAHGLLTVTVYFSEQLDALGKSLSMSKRYAEAVTAYERALAYDANDAYAHHYVAWNLDILAEDTERVLTEYTEARRLQDDHVWYHGRRICFLVTIGRLNEARDAWAEALVALQGEERDAYVAAELHRPIAQLLLHRGQLEFAATVLDDVSSYAAENDWVRSLRKLLEDMRDADAHRLVFPPNVDDQDKWEGPHLLREAEDAREVASWTPGRIVSATEEGIRVRLAERTGALVRFRFRDISHDALNKMTHYPLSLPVGTFIEILLMKTGSELLLSWPRGKRRAPGLAEIFPPPDRYIRRAFAGH